MSKLHRLYKRKLAAVDVVDEPHEDKTVLDTYNKYPQGEEPDNQDASPEQSFGFNRKIEGAGTRSAMIAVYPTARAAKEIHEYFNYLSDIEAETKLHLTLIYLGKGLTDEELDKVADICEHVCDAHSPLNCKIQGLGLFDTNKDGRPFYCSVDAVGMSDLRSDLVAAIEEAGFKIPADYDFTPHLTIKYLQDLRGVDLNSGSPKVSWRSNSLWVVRGDRVVRECELGDLVKTAGGFGVSLDEITTPSKGQGFTDNPADNHETENISEDPDLKLGEVEAPYSDGAGSQGVRFEDDQKYDIVKGADEKEAIGLPDTELNENSYQDYSRMDQAIPRPPAKEELIHTQGTLSKR